MSGSTHLNILDSGTIKLIEYGDQLNRKLGAFLKILSKFFLGMILVVLLIPLTITVIVLTTLIARISLEYLAWEMRREIKRIHKEDERTLMENHIEVETINNLMKTLRSELNNGKVKKLYFTLFFGSSWNRFINQTTTLQKGIEGIIYPNLNDQLSDDQVQRLLKEYEGLPVED